MTSCSPLGGTGEETGGGEGGGGGGEEEEEVGNEKSVGRLDFSIREKNVVLN